MNDQGGDVILIKFVKFGYFIKIGNVCQKIKE